MNYLIHPTGIIASMVPRLELDYRGILVKLVIYVAWGH